MLVARLRVRIWKLRRGRALLVGEVESECESGVVEAGAVDGQGRDIRGVGPSGNSPLRQIHYWREYHEFQRKLLHIFFKNTSNDRYVS